jgi:uncharacterized protein YcfJ
MKRSRPTKTGALVVQAIGPVWGQYGTRHGARRTALHRFAGCARSIAMNIRNSTSSRHLAAIAICASLGLSACEKTAPPAAPVATAVPNAPLDAPPATTAQAAPTTTPPAYSQPVPMTAPAGAQPVPANPAYAAPVVAAAPAQQVAPMPMPMTAPRVVAQAPLARVVSIQPIREQPHGTGAGAVIGGVLGAVVGNQFGHGNGRTAMTVLGGVGGAVGGNSVERKVNERVVGYRVQVRLPNGTSRVYDEPSLDGLRVGDPVRIQGHRLRPV